MRFEPDNNSMGRTVFDELAGYRPDDGGDSLTLAEVREATGLFDGVARSADARAACHRVRSRLFPVVVAAPRASLRPASMPDWLRVAAVVALAVTSLAMFKAPPNDDPASTVLASTQVSGSMLMFPGEAVIDAQLARLGTSLNTLNHESFWYTGSSLPFERINR